MTAATAPTALTQIEQLTKEFAATRDVLSERMTSFQEEMQNVRNRRMAGIKSAVVNARDARSKLEQAISANRDAFTDPRTITVHGIKVGIVKGKGRIEWDDEPRVVELIEKHFPDKAKVLVKTTKKPIRKAIAALSVADLKKIGATATEAGDIVLIKPADDEIDKLVSALLDEEREVDEEE